MLDLLPPMTMTNSKWPKVTTHHLLKYWLKLKKDINSLILLLIMNVVILYFSYKTPVRINWSIPRWPLTLYATLCYSFSHRITNNPFSWHPNTIFHPLASKYSCMLHCDPIGKEYVHPLASKFFVTVILLVRRVIPRSYLSSTHKYYFLNSSIPYQTDETS